jgi:hypothetical protein
VTIPEAIAEAIQDNKEIKFLGIYNSRGARGWQVIEIRNALTKERTAIATVPPDQLEAAALEAIHALQEERRKHATKPERLGPRVDTKRTGKALARRAS